MTPRAGWAAAFASLVILGGCSSTSDDDRDDSRSGAHEPTPSAGSLGPAAAKTDVLLTQDLPTGRPPRVPYLVGRRLSPAPWRMMRPDGDPLTLHVMPGQFAPLGDGLVSIATGEGGSSVYVLGPDGRLTQREILSSSSRVVVGAAGRAVGWVALDRADLRRDVISAAVELRFADGTRWGLPVADDSTLVGIRGGVACARHHDRCRVVVSTGQGTYLDGPRRRTRLTAHPAADVRADLSTISPRTSRRGCSAGWSPGGRRIWRDCRHSAVSFSPAGDHVLAIDGYGTQVATRRIFVLDDRGRVEASFRAPPRLAITGATWEDARHLLVRITRDWTTSYVVRVSVDGDAELVFPSRGRIRSLVTYELPAS